MSVPRIPARALLPLAILLAAPSGLAAQHPPGQQGSPNVRIVSHLPLGGFVQVADVEIEQETSRPFVYVSRSRGPAVTDIVSVADPANPKLLYRHQIENAELHEGVGGRDGKYFKHDGRYYYVQSVQYDQAGLDADLGAIVLDVTGLPDASKVREVGRIRVPDHPGGFHNFFMYKHSDGRPLLFTTTTGPNAFVYDMARFVGGDHAGALIARIPVPENPYWALRGGTATYHDLYVAYDPATQQDRFWGGGTGGYFVFNVTDVNSPQLLTAITGVSGVEYGHTFTPSPDGRFAVAETEYQYAPLRIFDLTPAWEKGAKVINRPVGAWTANWKNLVHNHEVRWPYVFVSGYEDGLQVFNMMDPTDPYTVAFYDTYEGPHESRGYHGGVFNGAFGVDVRNVDGLIVTSDMTSGLWTFRMDGFQGWNGNDWGMPNISSVQDWDNGPAKQSGTWGATRATPTTASR